MHQPGARAKTIVVAIAIQARLEWFVGENAGSVIARLMPTTYVSGRAKHRTGSGSRSSGKNLPEKRNEG
ncbi:MAG: hypothetical protein WCY70_03150 [Methanoculleus sp.]